MVRHLSRICERYVSKVASEENILRRKKTDDLARLVNGDTEPELPQEIEKTIRMILASKRIYPSGGIADIVQGAGGRVRKIAIPKFFERGGGTTLAAAGWGKFCLSHFRLAPVS